MTTNVSGRPSGDPGRNLPPSQETNPGNWRRIQGTGGIRPSRSRTFRAHSGSRRYRRTVLTATKPTTTSASRSSPTFLA